MKARMSLPHDPGPQVAAVNPADSTVPGTIASSEVAPCDGERSKPPPLNRQQQRVCEHVCRALRNLAFERKNGVLLAKLNATAPLVQVREPTDLQILFR